MLPVTPVLDERTTGYIAGAFSASASAPNIQQVIVAEVLAAVEADKLDLPVLPEVALKLQELLENSDSSIGQFVQLVSNDLAILLHIMKAANIAAFSNGQRIGNLSDAIQRLGYRMLYSIVMNIALTKLFQADSPQVNQKLKELWERSREVAANSYVLAKKKRHLKPEDAMLAGLIQEIGALPLYLYADRHYPEIDTATLDSLTATFSAPIGFRLLQNWNFPNELVDVVADQLDMRSCPQSNLADYVDIVTMAKLLTQEQAKDFSWHDVPAAERLGYFPESCKNFRTEHETQFLVVNSMLGIGMLSTALN